MSMLVRFSPWILFVGITDVSGWRLGLVSGLVAALALLAWSKPRKLGVLDGAQLAFFAVFTAVALLRPESGLQDHMSEISMTWFAVAAFLSLAFGHPFTLDFDNGDVPPAIAASALYRHIHNVITAVWASCFAVMAAAGFVAHATGRGSLSTVVTVAGIIVAVMFTKRYPDKAVAAATSAPADRHPVSV